MTNSLRLAVVGAGPIGAISASFAAERGHEVAIWAPRGPRAPAVDGLLRFTLSGAHSGSASARLLPDVAALADWPVILVAVPGDAYPAVLPALLPILRDGQTVILSGALSLAPLWLAEQAAARGVKPRIVAWGTTLGTGGLSGEAVVLGTVRQSFEMSVLPAAEANAALQLCTALFGDRFRIAATALGPILSNVNPIAHAGQVLPNLSRIERGEAWQLFELFTPAAGRIAEALDAERVAIAAAFGVTVISLIRHYHLSYHVPEGPLHEIGAAIEAHGRGPRGPATTRHRYLEEDIPYGLVAYEALGAVAGVPTPSLTATISVLSIAVGRPFRELNSLLRDLRLAGSSADELKARFALY